MGHAVFTPNQGNWRFMDDDAAEPTVALANENVKPTLANNDDIFRLRVRIYDSGDSNQNNGYWKIQHSTDESTWFDLDSANHFVYANGQATEDNIVTTNKLSDTSGKGPYRESVGQTTFDISALGDYEFDFAIVPTGNVSGATTYYFRVLNSSNGSSYTEIALGSETHPQVLTAAVDATTVKTITGKSRIQKTVIQTIDGKSRIQKTGIQSTDGKSRIQKTGIQTTDGKSRIQETTVKTITGKSRIQKTGIQTTDGKSRIQEISVKTLDGKSRIQKITAQTITGKAKIGDASITKTITGKSRIQETAVKTLDGKARIQEIVIQVINGKARIQEIVTQVINGIARIQKTAIKTITGKAKIVDASTIKTITGKASIIGGTTGRRRFIMTT